MGPASRRRASSSLSFFWQISGIFPASLQSLSRRAVPGCPRAEEPASKESSAKGPWFSEGRMIPGRETRRGQGEAIGVRDVGLVGV